MHRLQMPLWLVKRIEIRLSIHKHLMAQTSFFAERPISIKPTTLTNQQIHKQVAVGFISEIIKMSANQQNSLSPSTTMHYDAEP